jgi:hypothetical protein
MPKGSAYEELMGAVKDYEKSGGPKRDADKDRREEEERRKKAQEEERQRRQREGEDAVGARVRRGYKNMQELRDAASRELKARPYEDRKPARGGVRG